MKRYVLLCALSAFAFGDGAVKNESDDNTGANLTQEQIPAPPKVTEAKKDSEFKNLYKGLTAKGFAFGRYFTVNNFRGPASGQASQFRLKLDITTGLVYGYSLTGGVFFAQGSSAIDAGRVSHGDVQGSRGTALNDNFADRFSVGTLYASKEFNTDSIKIKIDAGKMNLISVATDKNLDMGIGGAFNMTQKLGSVKLDYHLSFFDSWMSDHANYNVRRRAPNKTGTPTNGLYTAAQLQNQDAAAIGIGNNLTMVGLNGSYNKNLSFRFLYANVFQLFDYMIFGDIKYNLKLGDNKLTFLGQIAFAGLNSNPNLLLGHRGQVVNSNFNYEFSNLAAKNRGIYNLQIGYEFKGLSLKLGYLGSFGDGYGVLLTSKGGMDMIGKVWHSSLTATYEGVGAFGSGSFRDTSLGIGYLQANYKFKIPITIGIDISYLFGNNNLPVLDVATTRGAITSRSGTIVGGKTNFINASFCEIVPNIKYTFLKNFNISFYTAVLVGDIEFIKTSTEIRYTF